MDDKAARYSRLKYALALLDIVLTLVLLILFRSTGASLYLKQAVAFPGIDRFLAAALYLAAVFAAYSLITLPFELYRSFFVEHAFGLSKQKLRSWFADYLKSAFLGLVFFLVLMEAFYFFIWNFPRGWWWMSASFWIFLSIVIARIFPIVLIPLFFKYKKLDNEDLRRRILNLAYRMRVKILDVFEIDYSKKSLKANAAFVGLGKSRRVLLADTLIGGKYLPEEIEAVLAHEFAHYRSRHLVKMVLLNCAVITAVFYGFFLLSGAGISASDISNLWFWLFLFMMIQIILTPFTNLLHRIMERNADDAAIAATGRPDSFVSMMRKLGEQNLADRNPPLWARIFFYDHPPIEERIKRAGGG